MPDAPVADRRARLGAAGFGATLADSKCSTLSGGEKARLLFLLATYHAPHVLILDEPTNHLDMDSRESLIMAINDYAGAVILIAHDRHIVETCADTLWVVDKGTVSTFDGDLDAYAEQVMSRRKAPARREAETPQAPPPAKRAARPLKTTQKLLRDIEDRMETLRGKIALLDEALADHTIYSEEPKKAADFARLRTKLAGDLDAAETDWLAMHEETENA
jgi:ATP-binding cassette subfamily F protein 3